MNKLIIILLLIFSTFLIFGCTSGPSVAISDPTVITIVDINGFTHNIHMHDLNDVSVIGLVVGNVLSWNGTTWVPTDVNVTPAGSITDTNWVTSWNVFDANMKATYALIIHDHNALYLLKSDANLLYALKGDVNTWINQLNKVQETDANKWGLTKLDGNALYAIKSDVNKWINSFQVDSNKWNLTKLDGNALYYFKGDINANFVPYTGANKDININYQNFYLINDGNNPDNLRNMATSIDEMRNNTLLDKSRSTLIATDGYLVYRLLALNGAGEWDFNGRIYGGSLAVPYADINLTCGTNASPVTNYVYFELVAGVPTLKKNTINITTEHIDVAIFNVGACSGSTYNIYSYNRNRYEVDSFIQRVISRFEYSGTLYESGFIPTVTATKLGIGSGRFFNGIFEMFTSVDVNAPTSFYFIKGDGTYVQANSLADLNVYTDGSSTGSNYVNVVWGIVPTSTTASGTSATTPKLVAVIQTKPAAVYTNIINAVADAYEATNYYPPSVPVQQVFVPIARTIVRSGAFIDWGTGTFFKDLRGKVTSGGGASTPVDLSGYLTKVDANGFYVLKTDLNADINAVLKAHGYLSQLDANGFYVLKTDINKTPVNTPVVANNFFTAYNSTTGVFSVTQPTWGDLTGFPPNCTAGTYMYGISGGIVYCSTPLDTNWQTSWSIFDANMKATYLTSYIDTNWVTSWTSFDSNMSATYRLYTIDLNTTARIQVDKNLLVGPKGYMYDDGNSIVIGRTA